MNDDLTRFVTPKTMSVPKAGRQYYGIGRNASYAAAKRGEIPVLRIGKLLRVPIAALERMLEQAGSGVEGPDVVSSEPVSEPSLRSDPENLSPALVTRGGPAPSRRRGERRGRL
jgi:hypothetical protein